MRRDSSVITMPLSVVFKESYTKPCSYVLGHAYHDYGNQVAFGKYLQVVASYYGEIYLKYCDILPFSRNIARTS